MICNPRRDREIARKVVRWFEADGRDLPWRRKRSGYRALVAELMLQQTQVARVLEYYDRFLRRFPTIRDLARADEQDVLAQWQGLGYYRRARHLHAAARAVVSDHCGRLPRSAAELEKLPGIGRYTAGAIASIVHDERVPIVDGNVTRVLARLEGRRSSAHDGKGQAAIWQTASRLVGRAASSSRFNEGLMELGALICTPRQPNCESCPLARQCRARQDHAQHLIPPPKPGPRQQAVHHHAVIICRKARTLLEQRPATGLWSNMWQVPTLESPTPLSGEELREHLSVPLTHLEPIDSFRHQTTHRRITFHVYLGRTRLRRGTWCTQEEAASLPLSNPQRRILKIALRA